MKLVKGLHKFDEKEINYGEFRSNFPVIKNTFFPVFCDEDGKLWTEHFSEFAEDTLKLLLDEDGMIVSYAFDVTTLGLSTEIISSIVEVNKDEVPVNFYDPAFFTNWSWNKSKGVHAREKAIDELLIVNTAKKKEIMSQIVEEITNLNVLEKHGVLSASDAERLDVLEKALISLHHEVVLTDQNPSWPTI
jgi:hypothetical protein